MVTVSVLESFIKSDEKHTRILLYIIRIKTVSANYMSIKFRIKFTTCVIDEEEFGSPVYCPSPEVVNWRIEVGEAVCHESHHGYTANNGQ